ncbi:MAG: response regulator [Myxococcaceae bacterium]|nr:response regulator [Myxococcaceae bacterium]
MKRILIVDDEFGIVEALVDVLGDEGYAVASARNGRDALKRVAEEAPDLIISDYMMPLMDGLELVDALQKQGTNVPFVLMTAVKLDQLPQGLKLAAILQKPFSLDALLDLVRQVLG